jgi:hypothetical protein
VGVFHFVDHSSVEGFHHLVINTNAAITFIFKVSFSFLAYVHPRVELLTLFFFGLFLLLFCGAGDQTHGLMLKCSPPLS